MVLRNELVTSIATQPAYNTLTRTGAMATYLTGQATSGIGGSARCAFYLFKPSTSAKTNRIVKIQLGFAGGAGSATGFFQLYFQRISAENATPGGAALTFDKANLADPAPDTKGVFTPTGAPTLLSASTYLDLSQVVAPNASGSWIYQPSNSDSKAWEMRAGQNEGIGCYYSPVGVTSGPAVGFAVEFVEF
jgi:hypothetical protein